MKLKPIYIFGKGKTKMTFTKNELEKLLQAAFDQGFAVGSATEIPETNNNKLGFSE